MDIFPLCNLGFIAYNKLSSTIKTFVIMLIVRISRNSQICFLFSLDTPVYIAIWIQHSIKLYFISVGFQVMYKPETETIKKSTDSCFYARFCLQLTWFIWKELSFIVLCLPHSHLPSCLSLEYTGFIQGSLSKIQGLFKDYSRLFYIFSRTKSLGKILIEVLKFFFKNARLR